MLCDVGGALDRAALVAALKAVQGVADADVDPDDQGGLGTLRLDLEAGVDETAVADQVSRVLREQFGLGVDADRVELVEVAGREQEPTLPPVKDEAKPAPTAEADEPPVARAAAAATASGVEQVAEKRSLTVPVPRASVRPSIAKIHLVSEGLDVTASVTLSGAGRIAVGEARGLASQSGVHKAVATATLRAVEELVGGSVRVELEHLEVTTMGHEKTVVVLLTLLSAQGSEPLTGAAAVRDDVRQAVIRATLDALNRRLELLLTEV
jgi:hypothetical protein